MYRWENLSKYILILVSEILITNFNFFLLIIIIFLITIQTIIGVGILVLGTPLMLLFFNYEIIYIINFLLYFSILTSFINILISKFSPNDIVLKDKDLKKNKITLNFLLTCMPGIFIGLLFLKNFYLEINFGLLISLLIILLALLNIFFKKNLYPISNVKKKLYIFLTGIVHGITNSGGTILVMFAGLSFKKFESARYYINYFYFYLASIQLVIFYVLFSNQVNLYEIIKHYLICSVVGIPLGLILKKKISNGIFRNIVNFIVIFSAISLFLKNI